MIKHAAQASCSESVDEFLLPMTIPYSFDRNRMASRCSARREHMNRSERGRRKAESPEIGVLMRYEKCVVRVLAEARGQRVIIESLDDDGHAVRRTVKWKNLATLPAQLF